jgi:hypothetical protein
MTIDIEQDYSTTGMLAQDGDDQFGGCHVVIHRPPELRTVFRHYALTLASYAERTEA